MTERQAAGLHALGRTVATRFENPGIDILEAFPNATPERDYVVKLTTDEFTSLCPKTGQPDFAQVDIEYVPNERCVETKSLKLYLAAYRNHRSFMEPTANQILSDLVALLEPKWMSVLLKFKSRGGIALDVEAEHGARPE